MNHLTSNDIWPLPVYEGVRDEFRRQVMAAKKDRRLSVGPFMTLVFENRLTVKFQVQEILRIEKISEPAAVAEEVEGFNGMLPGPGELSATLLIELRGEDLAIKEQLAALYGLSRHVWLRVGDQRVQGVFEEGREEPGRVSAVQYVRFKVPSREALVQGPAAVEIDHKGYTHRADLSDAARKSLAEDLG